MGRTFSLGFWAQIVIAPVLLTACSSPTEGSKAGPPAAIAFTTGTNQSALAGNPVAVPVVARVTDASGRGVPDVGVTFAVAAGDGGLASSVAVVTDQDGNATAPQWTLGKSAVPQTLRASIAEGLTATTSAVIQSNYTVDLRFFGPEMMPTTSAMFTAAAARIQAAVIGDLPDVLQSTPVDLSADSTCGVAGLPTAFSGTIDDVIIYASVGPIDGSGSSGGNILAFSFPCFIRGPLPARQTAIGVMKFDEADLSAMIAQGNLTDVIQHEMLHVVGLGTLWNELSLIQGAGTPQSRYSGTTGINGCIQVGGASVCASGVPLETKGGAGTRDSHWSDEVFFNELMTGFVNTRQSVPSGILNPLSVMSIQSLSDVGYTVNPKAADAYTIPGTLGASILRQLSVAETQAWEQVGKPRIRVTRNGKISRVEQQ